MWLVLTIFGPWAFLYFAVVTLVFRTPMTNQVWWSSTKVSPIGIYPGRKSWDDVSASTGRKDRGRRSSALFETVSTSRSQSHQHLLYFFPYNKIMKQE